MRPELLQAMQVLASKDPARIDEAVALLQRTVYSFSMKVCGHREDAEDNMQEVLFKALPHLANIEDPRAMAVWLYTVTRNQCWMARRKSKFAPEQTLTLDELMPNQQELSRLLADSAPSPESQAIGGQQDNRLRQAVLQLPPKYRLILVLHDMEELDTPEVAKVTGLREGTVRMRLHRARLLLRRLLAQPVTVAIAPMPATRTAAARRKGESCEKQPTDCREIFASLSEYLDGRLDPMTCDQMRKHIEGCAPCVAFIRDLERAIERCRRSEGECEPAVASSLRRLIADEYLRLIRPSATR